MSKYVENIDRDNSCNENQKSKIESPWGTYRLNNHIIWWWLINNDNNQP
jgi:hypothetical protein